MIDTAHWRSFADLVEWGTAQDAAKPYLTYYDDTTHERVELSYKTFANWVAKTSHLLAEAGADVPGSRVVVWLPSHWQSVVVLFAAWSAGGTVVLADSLDDVVAFPSDVVVVSEERLTALVARRAEAPALGTVVALSLRPMGGALSAPRAGVVDYADEVAAQPDHLLGAGSLDDPAVVLGALVTAGHDLVSLAADVVAAEGLEPGDRCLAVLAGDLADDGLVVASLACFVAGAGLVLCAALSPVDLARRASTEQVTVVAAPAAWLQEAGGENPGTALTRVRTVLARGDGPCPAEVLGAPVTRA